jgi:hypothetical protein
MASKQIKDGEELFLDYRLRNKETWPSWFVQTEQSKQRFKDEIELEREI